MTSSVSVEPPSTSTSVSFAPSTFISKCGHCGEISKNHLGHMFTYGTKDTVVRSAHYFCIKCLQKHQKYCDNVGISLRCPKCYQEIKNATIVPQRKEPTNKHCDPQQKSSSASS